jgi:hypothetical protein
VQESLLETFYEHLGAKPLRSLVQTQYIPSHPSSHPSSQAMALRKHVLERLTIFLAEARRKSSDYTIEFLAEEGNFEVQEVRDLKAKYTYRNGKHEYSHLEVSRWSLSRRDAEDRHCMRQRRGNLGARLLS